MDQDARPAHVAQEFVPEPLAAARDDHALAGPAQIRQDLASRGVANDGADGDLDDLLLAPPAVLIAALAVHAPAGAVEPLVAEIQKSRKLRVGRRDDVAAVAAVAAV